MVEFKGCLIPIGGNEDKGMGPNEMYTLNFVKAGILARVVKESGGESSKIIVITSASSIPMEVGENYSQAFNALNCEDVTIMDIRKKSEAESKKNLDLIEKADCVMFSGGAN